MRVAISEQFRAPPHAVRAWPTIDVMHAHIVLDIVEAAARAGR